jgi:O-acetyl-ADP-ribose deacetylase (regulator of RNase III)
MFKYKIGRTFFIITKGSLKTEHTDVLFNWTVSDLSGGDPNFMEIHREGGSVIYKECQGALARFGKPGADGTKTIVVGEAVITSAGILPVKKIVHCVVPNHRVKDEKENIPNLFLSAINYSMALINEHSRTHGVLRKIALTPFPTKICGTADNKLLKQFVKTLMSNASNYGFKEVKIICQTEEEYNQYKSIFSEEYISFGDRLYNKFFGE